ncbi:DUF2029 domain-containing protein [Sphingomonas ginkgonis]|uniref:DUF2029 domain-containing protein n=1 Tax=Sphingomonas ginkgonis TaxID=2315330 RepID=A0A3R9Z7Z5_9SPHN|nr:glycosyltransferase family 87 protein [Sphingomonas ginkgonis]RST31982.1 DUF2029 domain-containing protein [Sphingomonas ginkgonis]
MLNAGALRLADGNGESGPFASAESRRLLRRAMLAFGLAMSWWTLISPIGSMIYFHRYLGDYTIFWTIAAAPLDFIYRYPQFPYPPPSLILVRPFGLLPFWPSLIAWCIAGSVAMLLAARRMIPVPAIALGFVTNAGVCVLIAGQTGLFMGALVIAGLSATDPRWRGAFLAAAAMIKPQTLLAAPVAMLVRRDWRGIAWAMLASLLIFLVSVALFGAELWPRWQDCVRRFPAVLAELHVDRLDVGLYGLALRLGLPGWSYALGIPVGLATTALVFRGEAPVVDRYAAFACSTILLSPYTLNYDLAGVSLAAAAMLLDERRSPLLWLAAALVISNALAAFGILLMALQLAREAWHRGRAGDQRS